MIEFVVKNRKFGDIDEKSLEFCYDTLQMTKKDAEDISPEKLLQYLYIASNLGYAVGKAGNFVTDTYNAHTQKMFENIEQCSGYKKDDYKIFWQRDDDGRICGAEFIDLDLKSGYSVKIPFKIVEKSGRKTSKRGEYTIEDRYIPWGSIVLGLLREYENHDFVMKFVEAGEFNDVYSSLVPFFDALKLRFTNPVDGMVYIPKRDLGWDFELECCLKANRVKNDEFVNVVFRFDTVQYYDLKRKNGDEEKLAQESLNGNCYYIKGSYGRREENTRRDAKRLREHTYYFGAYPHENDTEEERKEWLEIAMIAWECLYRTIYYPHNFLSEINETAKRFRKEKRGDDGNETGVEKKNVKIAIELGTLSTYETVDAEGNTVRGEISNERCRAVVYSDVVGKKAQETA